MRNIEVVKYWAAGRAAKSGNLSTDGTRLWSYRLCIGRRTRQGVTRLQDHTAGGAAGFVSMTTSQHVNLAKPYADEIG